MRQSLTLRSMDQSQQNILIGANQPLSPTHSSFTNPNKVPSNSSQIDPKQPLKLKELKGCPSLIGLSTLDYTISDITPLEVTISDISQQDLQNNYFSQIYEENQNSDLPFKTLQQQLAPQDYYKIVQIHLQLPFSMTIEQVELSFNENIEFFQKYFKLLRIQRESDGKMLDLKNGAFFDLNKRLLELNTCGISHHNLTLTFLYSYHLKPSKVILQAFQQSMASSKERIFSKTQNVSDKIKNEILPLLNSGDESANELDDEVAMIAKKKGNELINIDEIKIEIKGSQSVKSKGNDNKTEQNQSEDTRNFNTCPRNYSEPSQKQQINDSSFNNMDIQSSQMIDRNMLSNEQISHIDSQIIQKQEDKLMNLEQEIFLNSTNMTQECIFIIRKTLLNIKVFGLNLNSIPAITNVAHFINSSFYFKKIGQIEDALEYDFIGGVLMISTKRYNQAVEVFRKIQVYYMKKSESITDQEEKNKIYQNCATLELLCAEAMCQPLQMNEKLLSLKRMCDLLEGKKVDALVFAPQCFSTDDPYTGMNKVLPQMLRFVILNMSHSKEIVRLSACKILEFILETQGCSLDASMVFILKAILQSYPQILTDKSKQNDSLQQSVFTQSLNNFFSLPDLINDQQKQNVKLMLPCSVKEPASGFNQALKNSYNHCLETYISVLSSISSHILHSLFYDVIIKQICGRLSQDHKPIYDVKIFAIKIAEKIITICQGDLLLNKQSLDFFLNTTTMSSKTQQAQNIDQGFMSNLKNLWQSIRSKVFTNYSQRGMRMLIEWLVEKMSFIAQNAQNNSPQSQQDLSDPLQNPQPSQNTNQDLSQLQITEEDSQILLQLFDMISMLSLSRKKSEEEANQLIKIKQEYCMELYLLINPLLFWLDFSVEREERFGLFKAVYQTIKDVLDNLPPKRVDIDILQIMIPILQRTSDYLKNNSPSLSMLKFLDIVLRDIKNGNYCSQNPDLQYFFLDMLQNFSQYISYCLYEEVFPVFDKLLAMSQDVMNESVLTKCIVALVDKYTMKSKGHKNSITIFMKSLLEVKVKSKQGHKAIGSLLDTEENDLDDELSVHSKNNYFEIMCEFCFFSNKDPLEKIDKIQAKSKDFRSPLDNHDLYIDKIQFFQDSLSMLTEIHINLYTQMITHPKFKDTILGLLSKGETSLRLKCHEILETVCNYYVQYCTSKTVYELAVANPSAKKSSQNPQQTEVMEVEYINHERLYMAQLVIACIRKSLQQQQDSYLQFNSLIMLDFLFQNLLPVPTYQNEQLRDKVSKGNREEIGIGEVIDIETCEIYEHTPEFEVTNKQYQYMRLKLIFKLWPYVQVALNSAWSNIRSICYGLICSMFKIDIRDFKESGQNSKLNQEYVENLRSIVLPMLISLLSSKESESKAGGLNILGSFCGLSYDFSKVKISKNLEFFKKNSNFITLSIWKLVFDLQDDWDITIKEAAVVLIQLCAPRDAVKYFDRVKKEKENMRFTKMLNKYGLGQGGINSGRDQSSRLSSRLGNYPFMQSVNSMDQNDEVLSQQIQKFNQNLNQNKGGHNILDYINNNSDELSAVIQNEIDQNNMLSSDIFENLGQTINSGLGTQQLKNLFSALSSPSDEEYKKILAADQTQHLKLQDLIEKDSSIQHHEDFNFFVDEYQDDQIQEIISIFRNDFKPPKNLWIEKNQSAAFNGPDYYSEIYSQAIDQFNQQQMKLQQEQQQQMQQQVSGSPKNKTSGSTSLVDALEDDLVKKYENERKEKEKQLSKNTQVNEEKKTGQNQQTQDNYMIFERQNEEVKDEKVPQNQIQEQNQSQQQKLQIEIDQSQVNSSQKQENIQQKQQKKKSTKKTHLDQKGNKLQIQVNQEIETKSKQQQRLINEEIQVDQPIKKLQKPKKTTDELIEEYERKISKTKQLLEEEKKKTKNIGIEVPEIKNTGPNEGGNSKSTPEFKSKRDNSKGHQVEEFPLQQLNLNKSGDKLVKPKKQAQLYISELSKGHLNNIDNAKLIQQINNCFNDNSFNNFNIGSLVMTTNNIGSSSTKHKQKLNKSFENILAANKNKLKNQDESMRLGSKKNLSSSPRRASSSGKKTGSSKSGTNNRKKYLDSNQYLSKNPKAMQNMKDLNYFIKTIEKDLGDKFNKSNLKDFNSMPTTPTSILKKIEDQVKALGNTANINFNNKVDIKAQMSNTCPNIAEVLNGLDGYQKYNNQAYQQKSVNQNLQNLTNNPLKNDTIHKIPAVSGVHDLLTSNSLTPSNISNFGSNFILAAQSQNSLSNFNSSIGYNDKFTFSKTQKIDFKDASINIPAYKQSGITARDNSNDGLNTSKRKSSPLKHDQTNRKSSARPHAQKKSRESQDRYLTNQPQKGGEYEMIKQLNKSLNNIGGQTQKKKENLSKSMIQGNSAKAHISPKGNSKKQIMQQMIKQQLNQITSHNNTQTQQTPITTYQNFMGNQYSQQSNMLFDYLQNTEQTKRLSTNSKTPIKNNGVRNHNGKLGGQMLNYSEIIQISPSSAEKNSSGIFNNPKQNNKKTIQKNQFQHIL